LSSADFQIIPTYIRTEAIADSVLIDVFEIAQETDIRYPVAITAKLFKRNVEPTPVPLALG
jgi:hypothetical protein